MAYHKGRKRERHAGAKLANCSMNPGGTQSSNKIVGKEPFFQLLIVLCRNDCVAGEGTCGKFG